MNNQTHPHETGVQSENVRTQSNSSRFRVRFGMLTLMLVAAVVCVWSAYVTLQLSNSRLGREIDAMQALQTDLRVEDATRVAVVRARQEWYDDSRWDVYLPPGHTYRLSLATRKLSLKRNSGASNPAPVAAKELTSGTHSIELRTKKVDDGWQIEVLVDDEPTLTCLEPPDWNPGSGSQGGAEFPRSAHPNAIHAPVVLFRRRFMKSTPAGISREPVEPSEGVMLWFQTSKDHQEDGP